MAGLRSVAAGLVLGAAVIAAPAAAQTVDRSPLSCDGKRADFHAERVKKVVTRAFDHGRILDPTPARAREKRAWREHKRCLLDRDRRERIGKLVDRKQESFDQRFVALITPPGPGVLGARRQCESGSDGLYGANTGNGYAGAYQFDVSSWASTAGVFKRLTGIDPDPSRLARPREQDIRASIWEQMHGGDAWPNCP